jgi:hypothetical protein
MGTKMGRAEAKLTKRDVKLVVAVIVGMFAIAYVLATGRGI